MIAPDQVFSVSIRFSALVAQLSSVVTRTGKDSTLKSVRPGMNPDLPVTGYVTSDDSIPSSHSHIY